MENNDKQLEILVQAVKDTLINNGKKSFTITLGFSLFMLLFGLVILIVDSDLLTATLLFAFGLFLLGTGIYLRSSANRHRIEKMTADSPAIKRVLLKMAEIEQQNLVQK